jgi:glycosyltransferase involved in cell wall biosynthesis
LPDFALRDVVLLSTAEWRHPFWTNKQHTAVELARQGCRVLYVDSLGLRRPTLTGRDGRRLLRRLRRGLMPPQQVLPGIWVWSPLVIPGARSAWMQSLNRLLLSGSLSGWQHWLGFQSPLLWTYNPLTPRLVDLRTYSQIVYHCVDNIAAQPGMDAMQLATWEERLCRRADLVFVTSRALLESRRPFNPRTIYQPNVVDGQLFTRAAAEGLRTPADCAALASPRLLFVGAISGYKVDFDLLRHLALQRPNWSLILVGAVGEGDPHTDASALQGLHNLHLLGPRRYDELPGYMAAADVALLPCRRNQYTRHMFPMKFFEYLAAGLPVVSTPLPALQEFRSYFHEADSAEGFIQAIERILSGQSGIDPAHIQALVSRHTYASRTREMLRLIDGGCAAVED